MLPGEGQPEENADGRGSRAVIGASWLALPIHQVTCVKHLFAHAVILETTPRTSTALPSESLNQAFTPVFS